MKGDEEMNEWQVIAMLITLITGAAVIIRPICNLTKAITELTLTCKNLDIQFANFETNNKDGHKRIWDHNEKQDEMLNDHEERISKMEGRCESTK